MRPCRLVRIFSLYSHHYKYLQRSMELTYIRLHTTDAAIRVKIFCEVNRVLRSSHWNLYEMTSTDVASVTFGLHFFRKRKRTWQRFNLRGRTSLSLAFLCFYQNFPTYWLMYLMFTHITKSYCFHWTGKKNFCSEMQSFFLLLKCIERWKFLL
jgi:hypothetical protein